MAKAELDILLNKLSGRLTGDSKFYSTHRYGKTVISNYPLHKDPKTISATQRTNSSTFGQRSKQATMELANTERHAYWQERYDQYKKLANKNVTRANTQFFGDGMVKPADKYYSTIRGFVIAQLSTLTNRE